MPCMPRAAQRWRGPQPAGSALARRVAHQLALAHAPAHYRPALRGLKTTPNGEETCVLTPKAQDRCYPSSMEEKGKIQVLLEVYKMERQSDQNSYVVVFAIIAAALTYV